MITTTTAAQTQTTAPTPMTTHDPRAGLPPTGAPADAVLQRLQTMKRRDIDYRSGRVFAYTYDAGKSADVVGKAAYTEFLTENALDPTVFPSLLQLEKDLVAMVAAHLNGPAGTVGSFTSGGTESILCAVKAARDYAKIAMPQATEPEILLPTTAHAAFHKAAAYFGLNKKLVPVDPVTFAAIPEKMAEAITPNTILMVGSTPSYAHGVIDPIEPMAAICKERGILFHVDACVGGFLLPYWKRLGEDVPACDLSVPGVTSLSVDLHKYAFCPKGASLVLFTRPELRAAQIFACSDWTGYTIVNPTVQSTKSGGPMAGAWAVIHHIGDDGYLRIAKSALEGKRRIVDAIERIDGLRVLGRPDFCMVAAAKDGDGPSIFVICDEMKQRGWYVQPQLAYGNSPENIHFSLHPGNAVKVPAMVEDLAESVQAARAVPLDHTLAEQVGQLFAGDVAVDEAMFGQLLAMAGIDGVDLPERMAPINLLLNALPVPVREQLLTGFMNNLYR